MLNLEFKRFHKTGVLILSGELLSAYLNDFKSALLLALDNSEQLVVNFRKVSKLDEAYIHMLCKAENISTKLKKHIIFNRATMKQKIRENYINCTVGCSFFKSGNCLLLRT